MIDVQTGDIIIVPKNDPHFLINSECYKIVVSYVQNGLIYYTYMLEDKEYLNSYITITYFKRSGCSVDIKNRKIQTFKKELGLL
jgi:oxalate decarboxylase/phosphoglucose isomerase-like protein (cupin superfamily)